MSSTYLKPKPPKQNKRKRRLFKSHRYAGWALYFWHGMRARVWWALLRENRFAVTANCLPNIITVTLSAPFNSLFYRISEAFYRRFADAVDLKGRQPIFVLGHWRSGTTFLHDLLASDPRFSCPTTYQCFFPHHFIFTQNVTHRWMKVFLPKTRPMDNVPVGMDRPQEDEFAYCNMGLPSPYMSMAFPRHGPAHMDAFEISGLPDDERKKWEEGVSWFLKRLSASDRRPLVLKSPIHTARIAAWLKIFPNARFVHISRNPLDIFPSSIRLWKSLNSVQGLQKPAKDDAWLEPWVLGNLTRMYEAYGRDRDMIPDGQLVEIAYEDLVADPKATLREIYGGLNLGDFARAEPGVDAHLARVKDHKPNDFVLPPEKRRLVAERWAAYFERFGYPRPADAGQAGEDTANGAGTVNTEAAGGEAVSGETLDKAPAAQVAQGARS